MASELNDLLEQYLAETISAADFKRLWSTLEKPEENAAWFAVMDELLRNEALHGLSNEAGQQAALLSIKARLAAHVPAGAGAASGSSAPIVPVQRVPLLQTAWFRYAAAVLLLLASGGAYMYITHRPSKEIAGTIVREKPDIAPGGNKAVLTLGNGQRIILDSARQGSLAIEGNARVSKTDSGKLAYQSMDHIPGTAVFYNTLSTPRGGQYQLTLPDGTHVWLNSASSITYPTAFTGGIRKVTITGEAYLEVARNVRQPFIAEVRNMAIQVLGTSFNINAYSDESAIKTTLLEGKVQVKQGGRAVTLLPGQQAQVQSGKDKINVLPGVDVGQAVAWKNGLFAFTNADVPAVMRQLARWYNVDVIYEGAIPKRSFNGEIGKSLTLSLVLDVLAHSRIHYTIEGNQLIIRP
jgi:transmembrane sensor